MKKSGQAAIEFMFTYGWAIIAAILVIGVLAAFGVFSPANYLPETCTIGSGMYCSGHQIKTQSVAI